MSTPFRRITAVCMAALIACCVAPSGAQERAPKDNPAAPKPAKKDPAAVLEPLQQLLKEYADENAVLKDRVKELEAQIERLKQNRTVTIVPQPGAPAKVPPNWKAVPFNGGVYYLVPLEAGAGEVGGAMRLHTEPQPQRRGSVITVPARPTPVPKTPTPAKK